MDLVSTAVAGARVGEAGARWFGGAGRWGMRFDAFEGIGFHVVLAGSAWLIGAAQALEVRQGDVVLLPSGAEHGLSLTPRPLADLPLMPFEPQNPSPATWDIECLCGAYRLARGQVHPFLRDLPALLVISPDPQLNPELLALISVLRQELSGESAAGAGVTRTALIDLIIVHTLRIWRDQTADAGPLDIEDAQIGAALQAIHANPQSPWTVDKLSAHAGLSRTAFTRRFAVVMGRSPMAYLTGQRLIRGARLLCDTESSLAVIAVQVGYSTEFAFANAFRREFGVSPGRYRRGHQGVLGLDAASVRV